jgi:hypothetical protein
MTRLALAACGLAYMGVFLWGYRAVVVPTYAYSGFVFNWPGIGAMAWVTILSLVPLTVIPLELSKPSVLIVWWLYVTAYVPCMLMPAITIALPEPTAIPLQLTVTCTMLLLCVVPYARTLVLPVITVSPAIFWWTLALAWTTCILICLDSINVHRILSNLALIFAGGSVGLEYMVRTDFMAQVSESGRLFGYVGREMSEALDPFMIAYGTLARNWPMLLVGVLGQLIYFGQTGMKEVPVAIVLIFFVWMLFRRYWKRFGLVFLLSASAVLAVASCVDITTDSVTLSAEITRRAVAGPGLLTGYYFEHYSSVAHPGHNFTGTGASQLYGPAHEIGYYYFNNVDMDANANFWAEGFAEFGIPGMFAFAFVVALSLWLYDSIAVLGSLELAVMLAVVLADALANSSPLTILVTHGGVLTGVLLYFAPRFGQPMGLVGNQHRLGWRLRSSLFHSLPS